MALQLCITLIIPEVDKNGSPSVIYPKLQDFSCVRQGLLQYRSTRQLWNHYKERKKVINEDAIVFYGCYISLAYMLTNTVNFNQPFVWSCISLNIKHIMFVSLNPMMQMVMTRNTWGLKYCGSPILPSEPMLRGSGPCGSYYDWRTQFRKAKWVILSVMLQTYIGHVQFYVVSKLICIWG